MKYMFNLSMDDVHPESNKHIADCGGDKEEGVFRYIIKLIEEFPDLKITLFVTPNWIDKPCDNAIIKTIKKKIGLNYTHSWEDEPFRLDKHPEWCEWLNEYVRRGNIEIAIHGLYHHRESDPHSAEFLDLSYEACLKRLKISEEIFKKSGLNYVKGFRPPGWGVSEGLFNALKDLNYFVISCYPTDMKITIKNGIVNIPQNWDIMRSSVGEGLKLLEKHGYIFAKGHIQNRYGRDYNGNGLTEKSYENIRKLLVEIEKRDVEFIFMEKIAKLYRR